MIFAVVRLADETHDIGFLFKSYAEFFRNTFVPDVEVKFATDFSVKGKTYGERKEYARALAINLQHAISDAIMSWGETWFIQSEMRRIGRECGLRREFYENAIC